MKAQIHPTWYPEAQVVCACGNKFTAGSTLPDIHVEVCSACHPFFTGQMRFINTAGRAEQFKSRQHTMGQKWLSKKERRSQKKQQKLQEELTRPASLEEVRKIENE